MPNTRTSPVEGRIWPVTSFMRVDLPAPFAPRSAVTPGPRVNETSFTAITSPNHLDAWVKVIIEGPGG